MTPDHEHLRSIKTFPQLVAYLRDELDWPISTDDFDELTFEYSADELGLDHATAAKIKEVKQLRPLTSNQPWGIFFVNFEPKRLPVVALRRILSSLVLKKRQSANKSQRASWSLHDLLFISSYGESEHREITFAHFSEDAVAGELPTLRVLGWDDEDTKLHVENVEQVLREKLHWPVNVGDLNSWRAKWSSAFTLRHREVITTSRALAERLAELARSIRKRANTVLKIETEKGPLRQLHGAFKKALIHDLSEDDFADMYAQTISYGLLTARVSRPTGLVADNLSEMVPVTNPFLKELLETFLTAGGRKGKIDFDELGIGEVVQMLRDANMEAVLRDFDDRNPEEDPVIHFYQDFLEEYDKKIRMERGVFYTPRPVVSFIVRSVDEILRQELGLADGLADVTTWREYKKDHPTLQLPSSVDLDEPVVQILDPAVGTATFLVEIIDRVYATMKAKWEKQGKSHLVIKLWNEYVVRSLLPRIYGFELMMAPYAIAHMKIGLKLWTTGYKFDSDQRARIFLTNSLEEPKDYSDQFQSMAPALAHEAKSAIAAKQATHITVVVTNPPYSNFGQLNRNPWILGLLERYKEGLSERKLNLDDDYIKFFCWCETKLRPMPVRVLGLITNNSYLDGATHRQMRDCLLKTFTRLDIINLHGNIRRKEQSPDGSPDKNVFDIQQGVAIALLRKAGSQPVETAVNYADLWGPRELKVAQLTAGEIQFQSLPRTFQQTELKLFIPQESKLAEEYAKFVSLADLFLERGQGIQTKQDYFCIQPSRAAIEAIINDLVELSVAKLSEKYDLPLETPSWSLKRAKEDVRKSDGRFLRIGMRPFDTRWTYYTGHTNGFHARPRALSTENMREGNVALVAKRQTKELQFSSIWVVDGPINEGFFSIDPRGRETLFPAFKLPDPGSSLFHGPDKLSNLVAKKLCVAEKAGPQPHVLLAYVYAILHSQAFRQRYAEMLRQDFPRIPPITNMELFSRLSTIGQKLIDIHLWIGKEPDDGVRSKKSVCGGMPSQLAKGFPKHSDNRLYLAPEAYIEPVDEAVWFFQAGGYQLCSKWLKDRVGLSSPKNGLREFLSVLDAIENTLQLVPEIDRAISQSGGWVKAFS
jgi:predicted helicase